MALIPRITPEMLSKQPDQAAALINRVVDEVNRLSQSK